MSRRHTGTRALAAFGITLGILAFSPNLLRAAVVVSDAAAFTIRIDANDAVSVDCTGGFVRVFDDGTPTTYTTSCAAVTTLAVTATGAFDNTIDLSGVTAAAFPQLAIAGQAVSLLGGGGVDTLTGSELNDVIKGGPGDDVMFGGAGDDVFTWVPGDGSDTIQGGAGNDVLAFVGAPAAEAFALTADGTGFDFTRDVGNIVMDLEGIEGLELSALGGNNSVTLNDLTGVADLVSVVLVMGDGDDIVNASAQANPAVLLTVFGGPGNDTLTGGPGADALHGEEGNDTIIGLGGIDTLDGGDGDDTITGGPGNDTQLGGAGNDTFIWNPGDGSDTLAGGAGADTMVFNGSDGNEVFQTTAQGAGFQFTRDLGNIVMNATEVEAITLNTLAGDDRVTTAPLAGTSQNLIGGTQTTADVLTIDAAGGCVVPSGAGTVTIAGALPISFSEFEQVNVTNQCVVEVPTLGPLAMAAMAAFLGLAAILVMRLQSSG